MPEAATVGFGGPLSGESCPHVTEALVAVVPLG